MKLRALSLTVVLLCSLAVVGCSQDPGENRNVVEGDQDNTNNGSPDAQADAGDGDTGPTDASDASDVSDTSDATDVENDVCEQYDDDALCTLESLQCGTHDLTDPCTGTRTVNCGDEAEVCGEYETCGGAGTDGMCGCTPITCQEAGILCGEIDDGCGGTDTCTTFCVDQLFSAFDHTCAIGSGKLKCWGAGRDGRLGTGSIQNAQNPTDVQGLTSDVVDAAVGARHSCAVTSNGEVKCWGANDVGQLGVGTTVGSNTAGSAAVTQDATQVVAGTNHTCAIVDGGVKCWGSHAFGQIGDPAYDYTATVGLPKPVPGLQSGVTRLAAGAFHTCALLDTGEVKCWGRNDLGQLGGGLNAYTIDGQDVYGLPYNTKFSAEEPQSVLNSAGDAPLSNVTQLYASRGYTCALDASNVLWCWGTIQADGSCNLSQDPSCQYFPAEDAPDAHVIAEVSQDSYGNDQIHRELVSDAAYPPVQIGQDFTVLSMAAGTGHLCLLVEEPDPAVTNVYCMGQNDFGQLGDGSTNAWTDPTLLAPDVDGNTVRAIQLVAAGSHSCALVGDNNAKCWGSNKSGQIGNSDLQREQSYQPFDVKIRTAP